MNSSSTLSNLKRIGIKALASVKIQDLELVDLEFVKEAGHWYLRYYIDKPGGVNLEDCQKVSNRISQLLDQADPISHSYLLEVSSPGIERPLRDERDFCRFVGSQVEIKTYQPLEGRKLFSGILKDFKDGKVILDEGGTMVIPLDKISSAKLNFDWSGALK